MIYWYFCLFTMTIVSVTVQKQSRHQQYFTLTMKCERPITKFSFDEFCFLISFNSQNVVVPNHLFLDFLQRKWVYELVLLLQFYLSKVKENVILFVWRNDFGILFAKHAHSNLFFNISIISRSHIGESNNKKTYPTNTYVHTHRSTSAVHRSNKMYFSLVFFVHCFAK